MAAAALEASNSSSYLTSASSLARAYSIVIRQISDLMGLIPKYNHLVYSQYPAAVKLTYQDAVNLQVRVGWRFAISVPNSYPTGDINVPSCLCASVKNIDMDLH